MAYAQAQDRRPGRLRPLIATLAAILVIAVPAGAEDVPAPQPAPSAAAEPTDSSLSPECRVPGSKLYTLAKLGAVKDALAEKRALRVLSVGSSSVGLSSSSTRLENALKRSLPDIDVEVESRGLPGEIASGAAERLRGMLAETEPDLVVWQVGMNDALARVELDAFEEALDETIRYVKLHDIDIVLIDPLFTRSMADDEYYSALVLKVQAVAQRERVPLVRRYEAMRYLSAASPDKIEEHALGNQFRLNDLGLRCMAEHAARAISLSVLQSGPGTSGTAAPSIPAKPQIKPSE